MKRRDLVRHLERCGCELLREGSRPSAYVNRVAGKSTTIPRHTEVNEYLARRICKDLDVSQP